MRCAVIVVGLLFVTVPAFGDQPSANTSPTARFGALRSPRSNDLYSQLFATQKKLEAAVRQAESDLSTSPKVVCGMLIVPADPKVDPKIAIPPNKAPNLEFKIRVIEPPICNPAK
jgi:hypothetical protein